MQQRVFLIGLMGSGKSYWAHKLSKKLNIPALDLDKEIEKAAGKTIAAIFAAHGEAYFRLKEHELLKSITQRDDFILATGGGAPCFYDNMDRMNAAGITIWIDEPLATIAARLQQEKSHRPLIAAIADENLESFFYQMREERKPFYSKAQYHLNSNHLTEQHFLKIILPHE